MLKVRLLEIRHTDPPVAHVVPFTRAQRGQGTPVTRAWLCTNPATKLTASASSRKGAIARQAKLEREVFGRLVA